VHAMNKKMVSATMTFAALVRPVFFPSYVKYLLLLLLLTTI